MQPDVTKVGGISEQRRIAWMADEFGVKYVGHGWNTALGVAADLQLAAALPTTDLVEFIGGSPYVDGILAEPFVLDADGYLAIPDGPGLGVRLDPEKLARFTPTPARCSRAEIPAAPIVHEGVACAPPSPGAPSPITNSCPSHNGQYTGGRNDDA